MARKTKEERAAYMRDYRARRVAASAGHAYEVVDSSGRKERARPPLLAAPVDTCPLCGHDRQEADHLGGRPCRFKTSPRRNCGCMFEGF